MAMRAGTVKTMFFAGGLMAVTNLLFALLAWTGKSELLFAIAVIADDITAAFATVAFVAFISLLVDRTYTATQYALLASIGTAGVPGVGLITLAMVLQQVGLPVEGIGLIIGVDRLLDMLRTVVNISGDGMVTTVVASSEKRLDRAVFNSSED